MKRNLLVMSLALAVACLGLAGPAAAQTVRGGDGGGETHLGDCFCVDNVTDTNEFCALNALCAGLVDCTVGGQATCDTAAAGTTCSDPVNGCGFSVCLSPCGPDICIASHVFGAGFPFPDCPEEPVPTLSQAGLILLGVLLLIGGAFLQRRRATMSKGFAASMLALLLTAAVGSAVAYGTIQSNRTCGDPNVVDLVQKVIS